MEYTTISYELRKKLIEYIKKVDPSDVFKSQRMWDESNYICFPNKMEIIERIYDGEDVSYYVDFNSERFIIDGEIFQIAMMKEAGEDVSYFKEDPEKDLIDSFNILT